MRWIAPARTLIRRDSRLKYTSLGWPFGTYDRRCLIYIEVSMFMMSVTTRRKITFQRRESIALSLVSKRIGRRLTYAMVHPAGSFLSLLGRKNKLQISLHVYLEPLKDMEEGQLVRRVVTDGDI